MVAVVAAFKFGDDSWEVLAGVGNFNRFIQRIPTQILTFISSDLFVLPSYSEALSVAAIEALRYSLPLLITKTCNFPEVVKFGVGIEVTPSQDAIQIGLEQLMGLSARQRKDMGERGFQLIKEKYSMDIIARQLSNKFERILRE